MHLKLSCSGGFTGPAGAQMRSVDLAQLPPARAEALQRLVADCDFFALPSSLKKNRPQPWDFEYQLEAEADGRRHTVHYHLDAAPPPLQALTQQLNQAAPD